MTLEWPWTGTWKSLEGWSGRVWSGAERHLSMIYTSVYPNTGAEAGADNDLRRQGVGGGEDKGPASLTRQELRQCTKDKRIKTQASQFHKYIKVASQDTTNFNKARSSNTINSGAGHRSFRGD